MKEQKNYFKRLDYIRIVSCIIILLYHLNILKGGFLAVCTFFALSGYLGYVSAAKKEEFSLKKYYINKFKRLYFPLAVIVLITVIVIKFFTDMNLVNLKPETLSVLFGYNNFWQLGANLDYFTRHIDSPFMHMWFIAILIQFDLVFPFIYLFLKKIDKTIGNNTSTIIVLLLTIASTGYFYYMSKTQDIMVVYYNTFSRIFSILFGTFLGLIHSKYDKKIIPVIKRFSSTLFLFYNIILISLCYFITSENPNYALFMILATILTLRMIDYSTIKQRKTEKPNSFIKAFSDCTYEIYLVQYPVIFLMQSSNLSEYIKAPIIIGLVLLFSVLIHYLMYLKHKKSFIKVVQILILVAIIGVGSVLVILEKDHSAEMKELEGILNENLKVLEANNSDYEKALLEEQQAWEEMLSNMDNEESSIADLVSKLPVVGIGDSVLLGASSGLREKFPNGYFDGKVSRSLLGAEDLLKEMKNNGKLGDVLIIALANNGDYSDKRNNSFLDIVGDREIYWVDAVKADDPKFNERFREYAKDHPNIHIIEWEAASKDHPEYFYADGIHLKGDGITAYAETIYNAIYDNYLEQYQTKKDELIKQHEEEQKTKITFYGNNILTNSISAIHEKYEKASFNAVKDNKELLNSIKNKKENNTLEHRIVLVFDQDSRMNENDYQDIIDMCSDYEIYICKVTKNELKLYGDNFKVIDFYKELNQNEDYTRSDKKTLTDKGNSALAEIIYNELNK